jgi:hypothetical protein
MGYLPWIGCCCLTGCDLGFLELARCTRSTLLLHVSHSLHPTGQIAPMRKEVRDVITPWLLVPKRTIPIELPPVDGEI